MKKQHRESNAESAATCAAPFLACFACRHRLPPYAAYAPCVTVVQPNVHPGLPVPLHSLP